MSGEIAFYSLVRYVADLQRGETINVGVLLASAKSVVVRFPETQAPEHADAVQRFSGLMEHLAEEARGRGADGKALLQELAERRFSHFEITEPRQLVVSESVETTADQLSQRLVASPAYTAR